MQQSTKRKLAKEILIFFSSIILIGLTWSIFWLKNNFKINRTEDLKKEIIKTNTEIDSIQTTFPKENTFEAMLLKINIPKGYFDNVRPPLIILPESTDPHRESEFSQTTNINIEKLYILLNELNYHIEIVDQTANGLPIFKNIKNEIKLEFKKDWNQKTELKKIYDFLLTNKCVNIDFEHFVFNLEGLPLPPTHGTWLTYQAKKKKMEELSKEVKIEKNKISSKDDLRELLIFISILVLSLIYPVRFIILSILWALRTVKQI